MDTANSREFEYLLTLVETRTVFLGRKSWNQSVDMLFRS